MNRQRLRIVVALAGTAVWLLLAIYIASFDGEQFVAPVLIALTPMILAAHLMVPDVFRGNRARAQDTLRIVSSPLVTACMASSFFLLAVVVGGMLWGWLGGLAGLGVGVFLATHTVLAMSQLRRVASPAIDSERETRPAASRHMVFSVAGLVGVALAQSALLGGLGYLLAGVAGAIVLGSVSVLIFVVLTVVSFVARTRRNHGQ